MKVKCVLIDDEPLALQLMQEFAGKISFLEIEKSFGNPVEALGWLKTNKADLVFLDINMPDIDGIGILKAIDKNVLAVFCTAYPDFALKGYEMEVVDYLVKPFSFERFLKAACKAQEQLILRQSYRQVAPRDESAFIFVKSEYSLVKINIDDIVLMEGLKDYVKIFTVNNPKPTLTLQSMRSLEEKLPSARFCRVHKSFLVNVGRLNAVQRNHVLIADREIPIGNQYKEAFLSLIERSMPG